ncbi:MAG: hypothetical protein U0169_04530 [Polyangiaceae bacterium]
MSTIPSLPRSFVVVLLLAFPLAACSSETSTPGTSSDGGSDSSSAADSGTSASGSKVVGGVTIPKTLKLCTQSLTASGSSTAAGFSWKAVPDATRYAVLASKAPKDAKDLTELFNGIVDGSTTGGSYTFPEYVSGTSYVIEVYAVKDSEPLCQLDGVNGITAK